VQLLLGIVAVILVLLARPSAFPRRRYALCILAAALVFLIGLRWQPWITRLQLPIFLVGAPLAAFLPILGGELRQESLRAAAAVLVAILLLITASPALWTNFRRPLFPPQGYAGSIWAASGDNILFAARPKLQLSYRSAAVDAVLHGDSQIGLVLGGNDWEYPLWRLLRQHGIRGLRIEHVDVRDPLGARASYPLGPFDPTALIVTTEKEPPQMTIDGILWYRHQQYPALAIYRRSPP
jgi:hypothetical protein